MFQSYFSQYRSPASEPLGCLLNIRILWTREIYSFYFQQTIHRITFYTFKFQVHYMKKLGPSRDSDSRVYEGKSTFPYCLNQAGINISYSLPQHPCQENPMDRGAWQATIHRIAKSCTWPSLSTQTMHLNRLCFLDWVDILLGLEKFYNPSVFQSEPYYGMGPANKILEITDTLSIKYIYRYTHIHTENKYIREAS